MGMIESILRSIDSPEQARQMAEIIGDPIARLSLGASHGDHSAPGWRVRTVYGLTMFDYHPQREDGNFWFFFNPFIDRMGMVICIIDDVEANRERYEPLGFACPTQVIYVGKEGDQSLPGIEPQTPEQPSC